VLAQNGLVVNINPAAEQLLGVSAGQAMGMAAAELFVSSPWLVDLSGGTMAEGVARRRGEGTLSAQQRNVPVSAACAPVIDSSGRVQGAVLVLHELTLEHSLEATTQRADRLAALGTVAAGLAHEIRNPLGGIKGAAQLLRAALADPELIRCTDIIVREVDRLDGLVEQLRELSVPPHLRLQAVNIHRVLNDVLALERQTDGWGTIALRTEFDPSLPPVRADPAQLTQVFLNLVKNAIEALAGHGELAVTTRMETRFRIRRGAARAAFISVTVQDSGPGVAPDLHGRLFSPFFSTKPQGTGLGLALCHRIVVEHGGTISYETPPTGGARFRVTLRVSDEDASDVR
jgi:two-component system nitrogen regulation sensor histidine kinase GlnL